MPHRKQYAKNVDLLARCWHEAALGSFDFTAVINGSPSGSWLLSDSSYSSPTTSDVPQITFPELLMQSLSSPAALTAPTPMPSGHPPSSQSQSLARQSPSVSSPLAVPPDTKSSSESTTPRAAPLPSQGRFVSPTERDRHLSTLAHRTVEALQELAAIFDVDLNDEVERALHELQRNIDRAAEKKERERLATNELSAKDRLAAKLAALKASDGDGRIDDTLPQQGGPASAAQHPASNPTSRRGSNQGLSTPGGGGAFNTPSTTGWWSRLQVSGSGRKPSLNDDPGLLPPPASGLRPLLDGNASFASLMSSRDHNGRRVSDIALAEVVLVDSALQTPLFTPFVRPTAPVLVSPIAGDVRSRGKMPPPAPTTGGAVALTAPAPLGPATAAPPPQATATSGVKQSAAHIDSPAVNPLVSLGTPTAPSHSGTTLGSPPLFRSPPQASMRRRSSSADSGPLGVGGGRRPTSQTDHRSLESSELTLHAQQVTSVGSGTTGDNSNTSQSLGTFTGSVRSRSITSPFHRSSAAAVSQLQSESQSQLPSASVANATSRFRIFMSAADAVDKAQSPNDLALSVQSRSLPSVQSSQAVSFQSHLQHTPLATSLQTRTTSTSHVPQTSSSDPHHSTANNSTMSATDKATRSPQGPEDTTPSAILSVADRLRGVFRLRDTHTLAPDTPLTAAKATVTALHVAAIEGSPLGEEGGASQSPTALHKSSEASPNQLSATRPLVDLRESVPSTTPTTRRPGPLSVAERLRQRQAALAAAPFATPSAAPGGRSRTQSSEQRPTFDEVDHPLPGFERGRAASLVTAATMGSTIDNASFRSTAAPQGLLSNSDPELHVELSAESGLTNLVMRVPFTGGRPRSRTQASVGSVLPTVLQHRRESTLTALTPENCSDTQIIWCDGVVMHQQPSAGLRPTGGSAPQSGPASFTSSERKHNPPSASLRLIGEEFGSGSNSEGGIVAFPTTSGEVDTPGSIGIGLSRPELLSSATGASSAGRDPTQTDSSNQQPSLPSAVLQQVPYATLESPPAVPQEAAAAPFHTHQRTGSHHAVVVTRSLPSLRVTETPRRTLDQSQVSLDVCMGSPSTDEATRRGEAQDLTMSTPGSRQSATNRRSTADTSLLSLVAELKREAATPKDVSCLHFGSSLRENASVRRPSDSVAACSATCVFDYIKDLHSSTWRDLKISQETSLDGSVGVGTGTHGPRGDMLKQSMTNNISTSSAPFPRDLDTGHPPATTASTKAVHHSVADTDIHAPEGPSGEHSRQHRHDSMDSAGKKSGRIIMLVTPQLTAKSLLSKGALQSVTDYIDTLEMDPNAREAVDDTSDLFVNYRYLPFWNPQTPSADNDGPIPTAGGDGNGVFADSSSGDPQEATTRTPRPDSELHPHEISCLREGPSPPGSSSPLLYRSHRSTHHSHIEDNDSVPNREASVDDDGAPSAAPDAKTSTAPVDEELGSDKPQKGKLEHGVPGPLDPDSSTSPSSKNPAGSGSTSLLSPTLEAEPSLPTKNVVTPPAKLDPMKPCLLSDRQLRHDSPPPAAIASTAMPTGQNHLAVNNALSSLMASPMEQVADLSLPRYTTANAYTLSPFHAMGMPSTGGSLGRAMTNGGMGGSGESDPPSVVGATRFSSGSGDASKKASPNHMRERDSLFDISVSAPTLMDSTLMSSAAIIPFPAMVRSSRGVREDDPHSPRSDGQQQRKMERRPTDAAIMSMAVPMAVSDPRAAVPGGPLAPRQQTGSPPPPGTSAPGSLNSGLQSTDQSHSQSHSSSRSRTGGSGRGGASASERNIPCSTSTIGSRSVSLPVVSPFTTTADPPTPITQTPRIVFSGTIPAPATSAQQQSTEKQQQLLPTPDLVAARTPSLNSMYRRPASSVEFGDSLPLPAILSIPGGGAGSGGPRQGLDMSTVVSENTLETPLHSAPASFVEASPTTVGGSGSYMPIPPMVLASESPPDDTVVTAEGTLTSTQKRSSTLRRFRDRGASGAASTLLARRRSSSTGNLPNLPTAMAEGQPAAGPSHDSDNGGRSIPAANDSTSSAKRGRASTLQPSEAKERVAAAATTVAVSAPGEVLSQSEGADVSDSDKTPGGVISPPLSNSEVERSRRPTLPGGEAVSAPKGPSGTAPAGLSNRSKSYTSMSLATSGLSMGQTFAALFLASTGGIPAGTVAGTQAIIPRVASFYGIDIPSGNSSGSAAQTSSHSRPMTATSGTYVDTPTMLPRLARDVSLSNMSLSASRQGSVTSGGAVSSRISPVDRAVAVDFPLRAGASRRHGRHSPTYYTAVHQYVFPLSSDGGSNPETTSPPQGSAAAPPAMFQPSPIPHLTVTHDSAQSVTGASTSLVSQHTSMNNTSSATTTSRPVSDDTIRQGQASAAATHNSTFYEIGSVSPLTNVLSASQASVQAQGYSILRAAASAATGQSSHGSADNSSGEAGGASPTSMPPLGVSPSQTVPYAGVAPPVTLTLIPSRSSIHSSMSLDSRRESGTMPGVSVQPHGISPPHSQHPGSLPESPKRGQPHVVSILATSAASTPRCLQDPIPLQWASLLPGGAPRPQAGQSEPHQDRLPNAGDSVSNSRSTPSTVNSLQSQLTATEPIISHVPPVFASAKSPNTLPTWRSPMMFGAIGASVTVSPQTFLAEGSSVSTVSIGALAAPESAVNASTASTPRVAAQHPTAAVDYAMSHLRAEQGSPFRVASPLSSVPETLAPKSVSASQAGSPRVSPRRTFSPNTAKPMSPKRSRLATADDLPLPDMRRPNDGVDFSDSVSQSSMGSRDARSTTGGIVNAVSSSSSTILVNVDNPGQHVPPAGSGQHTPRNASRGTPWTTSVAAQSEPATPRGFSAPDISILVANTAPTQNDIGVTAGPHPAAEVAVISSASPLHPPTGSSSSTSGLGHLTGANASASASVRRSSALFNISAMTPDNDRTLSPILPLTTTSESM